MCHFCQQKHPETFITHTGCNKDKVASSATVANSWFIGWYDRFERQSEWTRKREKGRERQTERQRGRESGREREKSGPSEWAGGMTVQQKQLVQKETGSLCCHQNISYATLTVDSAVLLCSTPPRFPLRLSLLSNTLSQKTIQIPLPSSGPTNAASSASKLNLGNHFLTCNAKIPVGGDMSVTAVIHPGHLEGK